MNSNSLSTLIEKYGVDLARRIRRIMAWIRDNPMGYETKGYEDIAKETNNTPEDVRDYFEIAMAELNGTGVPPSQFEGYLKSNEEIFSDSPKANELKRMYHAGCSNKDIAFTLGLPVEQVNKLIAKLFVEKVL